MVDSKIPITYNKYSQSHHHDAKQEQVRFQRRLRSLLTQPENKHCLDCSRPGPRWATLIVVPALKVCENMDSRNEGLSNASNMDSSAENISDQILGHVQSGPLTVSIGGFCCLDCSGAHRKLGTHVTFVRSVDLDTFKEHEVQSLESAGNSVVNSIYEARLLTSNGSDDLTSTSYMAGAFTYASKPCADSDPRAREKFIRNKYEARLYLDFDILCQFYEMAGPTITAAVATSSESSSSDLSTDAVLSLPGIHLCQVRNETLTSPLKLQAFTTSPRNLKMLQKYMSQSRQCGLQGYYPSSTTKKKVKKKIHTILPGKKSSSISNLKLQENAVESGVTKALSCPNNMCPDENDGVGFEINHPRCNPFPSCKDVYDSNNEHYMQQGTRKYCNNTPNLCNYVVTGSKTSVVDLVQTQAGDSLNSKDRGQHAGEVLGNFHSTVNPPYERYQTNQHDDSVSVLSGGTQGSSNATIGSALKRGWSSTAKRLAWRKGYKKKTSKFIPSALTSEGIMKNKTNRSKVVTNNEELQQYEQTVVPDLDIRDSPSSSSSSDCDTSQQFRGGIARVPLLDGLGPHKSSVYDDDEDVEVVFEPCNPQPQYYNSNLIEYREKSVHNDRNESASVRRHTIPEECEEDISSSSGIAHDKVSLSSSGTKVRKRFLKRLSLQCIN